MCRTGVYHADECDGPRPVQRETGLAAQVAGIRFGTRNQSVCFVSSADVEIAVDYANHRPDVRIKHPDSA